MKPFRCLPLVLSALVLGAVPCARAEELLRGPYPFRSENTLGVSGNYALGFGDTPHGPRAVAEYGFMWEGSLWLDLQLSVQSARCSPPGPADLCDARSGQRAETFVGLMWKLQTDVPAVPYLRGAAGPMFFFPDGTRNAIGFGVRAGGGVKYYLYEGFGLGLELTGLVGHAGYADNAGVSRGIQSVDLSLGAEIAF